VQDVDPLGVDETEQGRERQRVNLPLYVMSTPGFRAPPEVFFSQADKRDVNRSRSKRGIIR
jgi:hypothetical protein